MKISRRTFVKTTGSVLSLALIHTPAAAHAESVDLCLADARELARLLRDRETSAREVVDANLKQIGRFNPKLNAIVAKLDDARCLVLADNADRQQARGEKLGPLHGLPIAIKDTEPAVGFPYTRGSPIFRNDMPAADSVVVERLPEAGAIIAEGVKWITVVFLPYGLILGLFTADKCSLDVFEHFVAGIPPRTFIRFGMLLDAVAMVYLGLLLSRIIVLKFKRGHFLAISLGVFPLWPLFGLHGPETKAVIGISHALTALGFTFVALTVLRRVNQTIRRSLLRKQPAQNEARRIILDFAEEDAFRNFSNN